MSEWQKIDESTPRRKELVLFFPAQKHNGTMKRVDTLPVAYPRQPTHWMPLPKDDPRD